jgi:hypothetical protein
MTEERYGVPTLPGLLLEDCHCPHHGQSSPSETMATDTNKADSLDTLVKSFSLHLIQNRLDWVY